MKAPEFWSKPNALAAALSPLGIFTRAVTARRVRRPGFTAGIPVICVGNATVGGSGKTIVTLDLLRRLQGRPFALTRGYRGRQTGPLLVDPAMHDAAEVGDEALLLADLAPTILSRDRDVGARLAIDLGASAIVMDDGLQNPSLVKTTSFLVIDGGYGFGNGHLLPAGPLREPVREAAARCQAAILIGGDECGALAALPQNLPVLRAQLVPSAAESLMGRSVLAFAGIGRPEKFFASLTELGANLVGCHAFPDHHIYGAADIIRLRQEAARLKAVLVTTEKDDVKLPPDLRAECLTVTVRLTWEDESRLNNLLR